MAVCLGCGSRAARVIYSRSATVVEDCGECLVISRVCRQITLCPPSPSGCGQRRSRRIEDEGVTIRGKIEAETGELPLASPRRREERG